MSTLTQRFLAEVESEWGYLPEAERQSLKAQLVERLETLVTVERALGATDAEAQRRAVRAVGEEGVLRPPTRIRLSPHWQVALAWIALGGLISSGVFLLNPLLNRLNAFVPLIYVHSVLVLPLSAAFTTWLAFRWHPRGAVRGVFYGLGIWLVHATLQYVTVTTTGANWPSELRQEQLHNLLLHDGTHTLATLVTLWALQKNRMKKLLTRL